MSVRITKVHGKCLLMIADRIGGDHSSAIIPELRVLELAQKRQEPVRIDLKGNQMEPGGGPGLLGLPVEERQLGASSIARNHEGPARIVCPMSILWHDLQSKDALVPDCCFVPVWHEQLDMIDLPHSNGAHDPRRPTNGRTLKDQAMRKPMIVTTRRQNNRSATIPAAAIRN
jgi:hypothetical protein